MSMTEPRPFGVSLDDLRAVRTAVDVPLLCTHFVRTSRQERAVHADRRCAALIVGVDVRDVRDLGAPGLPPGYRAMWSP
jgi:hypothetical protein